MSVIFYRVINHKHHSFVFALCCYSITTTSSGNRDLLSSCCAVVLIKCCCFKAVRDRQARRSSSIRSMLNATLAVFGLYGAKDSDLKPSRQRQKTQPITPENREPKKREIQGNYQQEDLELHTADKDLRVFASVLVPATRSQFSEGALGNNRDHFTCCFLPRVQKPKSRSFYPQENSADWGYLSPLSVPHRHHCSLKVSPSCQHPLAHSARPKT